MTESRPQPTEAPLAEDPPRPFVALSRFTVRNGPEMVTAVRDAFRPHLVDTAEGFLRMDVLCPQDNPAEFWLITYWTHQDYFEQWHRSHHYKDAHKGIPKGLKLERGSFALRYFDHLTA